MPALPPPSMTIGAPVTGYAPFGVSGPSRTPNSTPALPAQLQSAGAVTNASGPTNITQTVTATKAGTFLVWAVAVNASAAAALGGVPTGWTLATTQAVATLAVGVYVYPNNPGGITAVTFSSVATATTGGIAAWFWEIDNSFTASAKSLSATGNSTSPASGSLAPASDANQILGVVAWVLGAATLTSTSTNSTGLSWAFNAQQSSTAGTTNAAIQTGSTLNAYGPAGTVQAQGTLSAGAVWVAATIAIPSTISSQTFLSGSRANVVDAGGVGVGDCGNAGWSLGPGRAGFSGGIGTQ